MARNKEYDAICTSFSRSLMVAVTADVKKDHPEVNLRDAWVYKLARDHWEFHYQEFYWHGDASDAYEARAKGWEKWMEKQKPEPQCSNAF